MKHRLLHTTSAALLALSLSLLSAADTKKIVMIAGKPSHGPAQHEHNAGVQLLAKCLRESGLPLEVKHHLNGEWPTAELSQADTIVIYADGGGGHPALQEDRLAQLDKEMKRGCGLVCLHYAVEPTLEKGNKEFIDWLGGAFEINWSVNPHWDADFTSLPQHPICSGVHPFKTNDEWYFHMRFRKDMKGVTPILSAVAPESTMSRADGHHSGNPAVRESVKKGEPQHVAWAVQREDGGRGFGFCGGHFHNGWGFDDQRRLVLNAIVWTAQGDVPKDGVKSSVSEADLKANLDPKPGQGLPEKKSPNPKGAPKSAAVEPKPAAEREAARAKRAARAATRNEATGDKALGVEAAREQMKNFKTPKGLAASLFAAEPMVQNPTNIDIDPRGRVWALESVNYRSGMKPWGILREEGDRVVILEDSDGDGAADKESTFFQSREFSNPLGLCVLPMADGRGAHVIVSAAPNVWLLTDADGDGKAEKSEIIFKTGGNPEHDHNVHAFMFGPDGKFYFNFGNEGNILMHPDGTHWRDIYGHEVINKGTPYRQGMIFRCDLDLKTGVASHVETLAHNFRNNYELCVDSFGGMWQSDNDDDGNQGVRINNIVDYGSYGFTDEMTGAGWKTARTNLEKEIPLQHWHLNDPGTIPNLLQTGQGSPTGICVNEGGALGRQFTNQVIHCDAGPRTVRAYPVTRNGAGYKASMVDILTTEDTWYRPSDCAIAPDGSLFVSDWYDPGVGGHNMGDNQKGTIRGRVYRVAAEGMAYKVAPVDFSTAEGCAAALLNPNNSTRFVAWTKLHAMGEKAENVLKDIWTSANPRYRARALHLLVRIPGKFQSSVEAALADDNSDVRAAAVREFRLAVANDTLPAAMGDSSAWMLPRIQAEANKQVLREYALTLRVVKDPVPMPSSADLQTENKGAKQNAKLNKEDAFAAAWTALAKKHDGNDRWYLEALGIASAGREDRAFHAWLTSVKGDWNTSAGRDIVWRVRSPLAFEPLTRLLTNRKAVADSLPHYLREFDFLPDGAAKNSALLKVASANVVPGRAALESDVLQRLARTDLKDSPEVRKLVNATLNSSKGTQAYLEIVQAYELTDRLPVVLDGALANPKSPGSRDAIKFLVSQHQEGMKLLRSALAGPKAEGLVTLLGGHPDKQALALLAGAVVNEKLPLSVRSAAVRALALNSAGALELAGLAETGKMPAELKPIAQSALAMVQYPGISDRINSVFPPAQSAGGKSLPPIPQLVKMKGDIAKGRAVFAKAESSCTLCHRAGNVGVDFAPALSEIGSKLGKDAIYDAIINPNAGISMGFETTDLKLKNGVSALGIVRSDAGDQLVLALPGGVTNTFARNQIATRAKLTVSMMPTGLQSLFSQEDLVNLVEYLFSLKSKSPQDKVAVKQ